MSKKLITILLLIMLVLSLFGASTAASPNEKAFNTEAVKPGKFIIEPPTLINLGFEWYIEGDTNHNAEVKVQYRKKGDREWENALPLLRIQNEECINSFSQLGRLCNAKYVCG